MTARWCWQCQTWIGDRDWHNLIEHQAEHVELDEICICDHVRQLHTDTGDLCVAATGCPCREWRPV